MHTRNAPRLFPVILAALLALLTFWLDYLIALLPIGNQPKHTDTVEYRVSDYTGTVFDTDGKLKQRVIGKDMWQFPDSKELHFRDARFELFDAGRPSGDIVAKTARYNTDSKLAWFDDKTRLTRQPTPTRPDVATLDTTRLTVDTDKHLASSPADSLFQEGKTVVRATGFDYNDNTKQLKLHSRVRMTHER